MYAYVSMNNYADIKFLCNKRNLYLLENLKELLFVTKKIPISALLLDFKTYFSLQSTTS